MRVIKDLISSHPDRVRILHLSDLHFTPETSTTGGDKASFLRQLEDVLNHLGSEPEGRIDLMAVTGDLSDFSKLRKREDQHKDTLEKAKSYLHELVTSIWPDDGGKRLLVIPGNHDYRWFGNTGSKEAEKNFKNIFVHEFQHTIYRFQNFVEVAFGCFDSNHEHHKGLDFARGLLRPDDVSDFSRQYNTYRAAEHRYHSIRVALIHHHPLPVTASEPPEARGVFEKMRSFFQSAPELLLLRNSGTVLWKLLQEDFRLVLHGHLHGSGYWRAMTTLKDGSEKWIEVISANSAHKSDEPSFNIVDIHRDGFIETVTFPWSRTGIRSRNFVLGSAPYNDVREISYKSSVSKAQIHSQRYVIKANVDLSTGDLDSDEAMIGYRSRKSAKTLEVFTASESFTSGEISLFKLEGPCSFNSPVVKLERTKLCCTIQFEPPLRQDDGTDVLARYSFKGVMDRSKEDQLRLGKKEVGWDEFGQRILRPTDQLIIQLKFSSSGKKEEMPAPEDVFLEVRDQDGRSCSRETDNGHISFDYWSPKRIRQLGAKASVSIPEATLTVTKPQVNFTYVIKWQVPEHDIINSRNQVSQARLYLLQSSPSENSKVNDLLIEAINLVEATIVELRTPLRTYGKPTAYLYAFDDSTSEMVCRTSTAVGMDHFASKRIAYGFDLIGTCFRRNKYLYYSYGSSLPQQFRTLDSSLFNHLLAFPLAASHDPSPIGVLAFVFAERHHPVLELISSLDLSEKLAERISERWKRSANEVLGFRVEPTSKGRG